MARALLFLMVLGLLAWLAWLAAEHPGSVSLRWQGWRVDTSVTLLLAAVAIIAAVTALLYRLWVFLRRAPVRLRQARRESRRRRGYLALTRGMVAVAAGDAADADRQVKRADVLLDEPPLTMLLSAQAAQLVGDEHAAGRFFTAMLDRPETEFLGVRGLLTQAMKRGDEAETLKLAQRAYGLKPDSEWVAASLFDQQVKGGRWAAAEETLDRSLKSKLVPPARGRRHRAVLAHQQSLEASARGDAAKALKLARTAHRLEPAFVPAAARLASLLAASGKHRKAAAVVEKVWRLRPHPDLLPVWRAAHPEDDALGAVRTVQRLAELHPGHEESHIAVAEVALEAKLWGEARKHLKAVAGNGAAARVCRLMARLEESEHGDMARARDWLMRSSLGDPGPAWVCSDCGTVAGEWVIRCGKCKSFDSLSWQMPPRIVALESADTEAPTQALPAAAGKAGAEPA